MASARSSEASHASAAPPSPSPVPPSSPVPSTPPLPPSPRPPQSRFAVLFCFCCVSVNRNAALILAYAFLFELARSVFFMAFHSIFVSMLTNTATVGYVAGVNGLMQIVTAPIVGTLSDKFPRQRICFAAALIGLAGAFVSSAAFVTHSIALVFVASGIWGTFQASSNASTDALFADSVTHGSARARMFSYKSALMQLGIAFGPLLSIFLFAGLGNSWTLTELEIVLLSGVGLVIPPLILLLFVSDRHALVEETVVLPGNETKSVGQGATGDDVEDSCLEMAQLTASEGEGAKTQIDEEEEEEEVEEEEEEEGEEEGEEEEEEEEEGRVVEVQSESSFVCVRWAMRHIAFMLTLSDFLIGLGAGMTIKFFPLFFASGGFASPPQPMSPIAVSALYFGTAVLAAGMQTFVGRVSAVLGRITTMLIVKVSGITLLLMMCISMPVGIAASLYAFRTAFMNSARPLSKSVIADSVAKNKRGRWLSLESLTSAGFAGSAVAGGAILTHFGYRVCFLVTAGFYVCGTALILLMLPLDRRAGARKGLGALRDRLRRNVSMKKRRRGGGRFEGLADHDEMEEEDEV